jgi:hypothetical protein
MDIYYAFLVVIISEYTLKCKQYVDKLKQSKLNGR